MKFDLILLHPGLFLPRGQHLVALKTHEPPTYADWAVIDRELRERNSPSDSAPYPPFSYTSRKRTTLDFVNPFLLILNAGRKLRHHEQKYGFAALTNRQLELAQLTLKAYDLVLHRPPGFVVEPPSTAVPSMPPLLRHIASSQQVPSSSAQTNDNEGEVLSNGAKNDQMAVDGMYQDDEERNDSGSEANSELLSADESHRILARFEDPSTTLEERKDLVDLLLDGARRESPLHLLRRRGLKVRNLTVILLLAYRPFPVVPGVELPEVPSLFGRGRQGS